MSDQPAATGNIYDLGYRRYEGLRLGRRYSIVAVYVQSLRAAFGMGRPATAKIVPIGLAILTLVPAVIQLGIAAVADDVIELYSASGYYEYIQWLLALFVAAQAPELVGRDQRYRTLTLYFSRSLRRSDYAMAKVAALTSALLVLTLVPQAVLFIGRAFAGEDAWGYTRDNWEDIPAIVASGLLLSLLMSCIALAIASHTKRRSFATGGVLAYFAISFAIGGILLEVTQDGALGKFVLLVSAFHIIRGFTLWLFGVTPSLQNEDLGLDLALAGLDLYWYAVEAVLLIALCLWVIHRRFQRVQA